MSDNEAGIEESLWKQLLSKSILEKEKAWEVVYELYYSSVLNFVCANRGTETDAADIFHDGLIILRLNLNNGTFRKESTIKTYVFGICKNLWLKELAKRNRQRIPYEEMMAASSPDINYLINAEVVALLMPELKEDCRDMLTEYYFNKKSMAELKDIFKVGSIQAAKNKKERCLTYLTKLVKEKGMAFVVGK
jgi:RNA polymerase sigma factor (sigma-70 family)